MTCMLCDVIKKGDNTIFQNEKIAVLLHPEPAVKGHVLICPIEHQTIIEQIPDFVISQMFTQANKICTRQFEALQAEGTNVLVQNGIPAGQTYGHFGINIIPRTKEDGLNLVWQPKQMPEDAMNQIHEALKKAFEDIGNFEKEKPKPIEIKKEEVKPEEDYLLKSLKRLP